ncbi:MAG: aromatic amino acid transaminase [Bacillota bacterium]
MQSQGKTTIMQLLERYSQDERLDKMNLTAGIYTDESGISPILKSVREAEYYRVDNQISKASFNLIGAPEFHKAVQTLLFPYVQNTDKDEDVEVIQTLGASGALHLAGQLISYYSPSSKIWMSSPTWENHADLLGNHSGGFAFYRYEPESKNQLCMDTILEDLAYAKPGDFVLLHTCCHNPTGMDPTISQWKVLADFFVERELIPLFDFAYQGFANSLQRDAEPLTIFRECLDTVIVCNSFSKNMGIYDERTGALTLVFRDKDNLSSWKETAKKLIRSNYSMPPVHGSFIVSHIVNDPERFACWEKEVEYLRKDLDQRRNLFFSELSKMNVIDKVLPYLQQKGMFLYLNLSLEKIECLRDKYGIYLLDNGRMCVASLNSENTSKIASNIRDVI